MKITLKIILLSTVLAFVACSKNEQITIDGVVAGGMGDTLTIKHLQNNQLTLLDSKVLKSNGRFKFSLEKQAYPEYYFLQVNDGSQLVIIRDSFDVISIDADAQALHRAKIEGSQLSEQIQETMLKVSSLRAQYQKYASAYRLADIPTRDSLTDIMLAEITKVKAFIGDEIYKSPRSYYSYYALFQRLNDDNLLFSPYNDDDYRYFATVATAYDVFQKKDPRTKALYDLVSGALKVRRRVALKKMIDDAPGGMPDIVMEDYKGVVRKLSDHKGQLVILNFWSSVNKDSRVYNQGLLNLYNKYKNRGVTVFQVSADKSKILWQEAIAKDKLPWDNVCDFKVAGSQPIMLYNVKQLPATFLIGRDGVLASKHTTIADLEKGIKELL